MAKFDELIQQINDNVTGNRNRGTAFEKLVVAYLENEPKYKHKYDKVWMLKDVPEEYNISKKDTGVDIVARDRHTGKLTAVQAKFYKGKVSKATIDSFLSEEGKSVYNDGILVTTTDKWGRNAENDLDHRTNPVALVTLSDLRDAHINWQLFNFEGKNKTLTKEPREPRGYQRPIIQKALDYYKLHDRGKLIMAPGTGKTFTSLQIAEGLMKQQHKSIYHVLYLVPSIQLLSQTLRSWNNDADTSLDMESFSVVSDAKASKNSEDLSAQDIGFPATTDVEKLLENYKKINFNNNKKNFVVVFSTYQSIDKVSQAQKHGFPEFDLIVADEAHRTTGSSEIGDPSVFTEVHDNKIVKAEKRLYQTATPKIYGQNAKKKAVEQSIEIASMDDESIYGKEIVRLTFGQAVNCGALTDYKVSVLAIDEHYIHKNMQGIMKNADNELDTNDIGKIIGVWNAMVKRNGITGEITGAPMKRAIAFSDRIAHSKQITKEFNTVINEYLGDNAKDSFSVDVRHVDGSMDAMKKKEEIDWLAGDVPENQAHILSNVQFLTEGIDVPNLDAMIFFSPKKSQIDIVQAVGRIMREFEGKEYGYIILPIVVDAQSDPAKVLDDNKKYKEVWQVLNALRSVDERFEATINQLQLNKKKPDRIGLNNIGNAPSGTVDEDSFKNNQKDPKTEQLKFDLDDWKDVKNAFYGRIVEKVGNRKYLEDFSKDVADIAKRDINKINDLIATKPGAKSAFDQFIKGLHYNINDSITKEQAIEMMAQHLITQPIFDALFSDYHFAQKNPVSQVLNKVISAFELYGFDKEQKSLEPLYESVRERVEGLDNVQAKQKVIIQLYNSFFKTGFPKTTESMGIVFTPVEVVDFIIHSADCALNKYFGKSLASENVHILDPFTGTGTFITRTLQYLKEEMDQNKITYNDILRKYLHELHANEIILLSYYIAAVNIEAVFDEINGPERGYEPFEGIVLTDTFESTENQNTLDDDIFGTNNKRLKKQQETPITAIISNPPYSVGQKNANDNNQNIHYPELEKQIEKTYLKETTSTLSKSSYDSYIKAFRWASDRIGKQGVIGFITNSGYLDKGSLSGLRKNLHNEFNHIYVYNLRGAIKGKVGEFAKAEGQNIFNILTGVAIIILVKDNTESHEILYKDIGKYLSRKQKLDILNENGSIAGVHWSVIKPDENNDWINQRDPMYKNYPYISGDKYSPFLSNAVGISTNRDYWVSGFSKQEVLSNTKRLIDNYNAELKKNGGQGKKSEMRDPAKIKWTRGLDNKFKKGEKIKFNPNNLRLEMYRPFVKRWLMYDRNVVEMPGQYIDKWGQNNAVIYTTGRGIRRPFSLLVTNCLPNLDLMEKGQGFLNYNHEDTSELIPNPNNTNELFAEKYGIKQNDIFPFIYGLLNSPDYQKKYANDLMKDLARIPNVKQKEKYIEVGQKLIDLHLNYEKVPMCDKVSITNTGKNNYKVSRMINDEKNCTVIFNKDITISNIPEKAYRFIINGKSAIAWIADQYGIKTDKHSGIVLDPNSYSNDPKYIFNLLLRIINLSVQTVDLINQLPPLKIEK